MHLVERRGELRAIVGHALVDLGNLIVGGNEGALAVLWAAQVVVCDARNLSEAAGVVFFESGSLLQEGCEFLVVVS